MKIGVWLNEQVLPTMGGGASYTLRLLSLLDKYEFSDGIRICYVSIFPVNALNKECYNISQIPHFVYYFFSWSKFFTNFLRKLDKKIISIKGLRKVLRGTDIKMIYYILGSNVLDLDSSFPFIATNWDIGHRSTYPFPELCNNMIFESRDKFYMSILPKAMMIICESETGKKELIDYTNIGAYKIRVMPLFSGGVSTLNLSDGVMKEILKKLGIERNRFFYYPAQFWPHKNHYGLLKAFQKFIQDNKNYFLVLSGSDKGNLTYIKNVANELDICDKVLFLGFISEEEVYTLYKNATCLVMASHFGPTNMPPIEAMELGCPVACTDLGGHREILGESAVYFDSFDDNSIYNALVEITHHRDIYLNRVSKQKKLTIFNSDNAIRCLDKILTEAVNIRKNWDESNSQMH